MSDSQGAKTPEQPPEDSGSRQEDPARRPWDELGRQIDDLGESIAEVVRVAVNDPENRRRMREVRQALESMAGRIADAFDDVSDSPQGQRVREQAAKAGESVAAAGRRVADDVRPHLIGAARQVSDRLREAAADMERRSDSRTSEKQDPPGNEPSDDTDDHPGGEAS